MEYYSKDLARGGVFKRKKARRGRDGPGFSSVTSESEDVEILEDQRGVAFDQVLRQITDMEIMTEATNQQRNRYACDAWDGKISEFFANRNEVTVAEVLCHSLHLK